MAARQIQLRKVEVHNLKAIDLDLPRGKLIVFCGLSGSGKSSLAFDTLYAEGQRRYIESFSAYTRQFLERLEKPQAERIEGLPPSIAVAAKSSSRSTRSTVGTVTEANDYLRLLFSKIARLFCLGCGREVVRDNPQTVADSLVRIPAGLRFMIAVPQSLTAADGAPIGLADRLQALREDGFTRVVLGETMINLAQDGTPAASFDAAATTFDVVVDRLKAGDAASQRVRDSLETAFAAGDGRAVLYIEQSTDGAATEAVAALGGKVVMVDGASWRRIGYVNRLACEDCGRTYPEPEPRLFSFNSPLGACPECEGFGNVIDIDLELVVPDPQKSLKEGAIAPWNTPAYQHELKELLSLAKDYGVPVDVPFKRLTPEQLKIVVDGAPERSFGGLKGFFAWLEKKKYKMHIRVFLSRWRSYRECPTCHGARLRPEPLAWRIGGKNIAEIMAMKTVDASSFFRALKLTDYELSVGRTMLEQVQSRIGYLEQVGLGYLTLDRTVRTLSGGEMQRVTLTSTLGSGLVNMLYVLDEPSAGLHPRDTDRLITAVKRLRDRGNSVVVVEHDEAMIRAADQVVEIGPGAGRNGGRVVFQGSPQEMEATVGNLTGDFLAGRRGATVPSLRRKPEHGWVRLAGARGNNLKNITVEFPLGVLCVVTGVSGAGKSTLVQDTLYPALCRRMHIEAPRPLDYDDVFGDGQLDDIVLVDQSPIGRSPRSNPVTYVKAFDEIRAVFADTVEARTRNYTAGYFSFNVEGGRCERCQGDGYLEVDMQFLADVFMKCPECRGKRYRKEILDVTYRNASIADVLDMTVREAFTFFRGSTKVQAKLKKLMDVGLDYLQLGQPANTLSGGESQRLKLAGYMASARKGRALFILDEPTSGLHFADVVQLMDCFEALLGVGHSLLVVEHNMTIIKGADYLIDLGPGAADEGGRVVAKGSPEQVARIPESATGRVLAELLEVEAKAAAEREKSA
ncbi:MAG: excinuclease ABC subunit UvrA [Planctomycetaceae bacterium]|nr:excinuclease ABC subunit UvrA [Planctomycetaceae bacterium]